MITVALAACADPLTAGEDAPLAGETSLAALPRRLAVAGPTVVDPDGRPILLRGYNWGQWGTEQPQDGADNFAQGANVVRLPLRWWGEWKPGVDSRRIKCDDGQDCPGHIDPDHLDELDHDIELAATNHLWVVLFVDSNYGQGANDRADNFWTNPAMKQQFIEVWQFLAARYKAAPYIGALEILAEPQPPGVADVDVKAFYDSIIPVLRAIDRRTPIVVGPNRAYNLHHLDAAYTTIDSNLIYTGNILYYDTSKLPELTAFRAAHHAPVWVDQLGIENETAESLGEADDLLTQLQGISVGWAWWTYRELRTDDAGYGIYYQDPQNDTKWKKKRDWFDLMTRYLN